jgi:5-methylcytosine-specific restriction protein A
MARRRDPRPSARQRGYDAAWQKLRTAFIAEHPVCAVPGCGAPSAEVDHVRTVRERPDLRLEPSNLRALCKGCHSRRTASRDKRPLRAVGCHADGTPRDPANPWHRRE